MISTEKILQYMENRYRKRCPLGVYTLDLFRLRGLIAVCEIFGQIRGVCIFRKIKISNFDPRNFSTHCPRGDCAFVMELCADNTRAVACLEKQMRDKLGKCRHIGMHRRGRAKFYDYEKYINKLLGKERL